MNSNLKGLLWNSLQQLGTLGINFIAIVVLARLLSPQDYALYGIIIIFISISEQLADSGIGGYIIKTQNVCRDDYNTLFVYNITVSAILYLVLFFAAPYIAEFYGKPVLQSAIRVLGLSIILQGLSITQLTRLLKELRFKTLAIISVSTGTAALALAIFIAWKGYGIWALIYQNVALAASTTLIYFILNRQYIPHFRFKWGVFKKQFSFGINLLGSSILSTITNNITNNVIAKMFSINTTGLYVQASKLQNYPISIVSNVVDRTFFPIFSRYNNDMELLKEKSANFRRYMYAVLFIGFTLVICFAKPIVLLVLGAKWIDSTPFFQILMLASYPMLVTALNRNILKSLGKTTYILYLEIIKAVGLLIGLVVAICADSIIMITAAFVATQCFAAIAGIFLVYFKYGFSFKSQIADILIFLPNVLIMFIVYLFFDGSYLAMFAIDFILLLLSGAIYYRLGIREYRYFFALLKDAVRRVV